MCDMQEDLGWSPIVASWLSRRHPEERESLHKLFTKFVAVILEFIRQSDRLDTNVSIATLHLLYTLLNQVSHE